MEARHTTYRQLRIRYNRLISPLSRFQIRFASFKNMFTSMNRTINSTTHHRRRAYQKVQKRRFTFRCGKYILGDRNQSFSNIQVMNMSRRPITIMVKWYRNFSTVRQFRQRNINTRNISRIRSNNSFQGPFGFNRSTKRIISVLARLHIKRNFSFFNLFCQATISLNPRERATKAKSKGHRIIFHHPIPTTYLFKKKS